MSGGQAQEPVPFRLVEPKTYPPQTVALPCTRCGARERTVSVYAAHDLNEQYGDAGFWTGRSLRFCERCVRGMMRLFDEAAWQDATTGASDG